MSKGVDRWLPEHARHGKHDAEESRWKGKGDNKAEKVRRNKLER